MKVHVIVMARHVRHARERLGSFLATAICGNDIFSTSLYVTGIAALLAGLYAPLVLLGVAGVLALYRAVYREVVEALPLNGGAYNALLNATSKTFAALAGVLTILSYVSTAVISGKTAVEYLFRAVLPTGFEWDAWLLPATGAVLLLFALLVLMGVRDSAKVAAAIFLTHLATLVAFLALTAWAVLHGNAAAFAENSTLTAGLTSARGGLLPLLFFAFSASLLGVSGFESSANFVEEQKRGVFAKTLRNMTIGTALINPFVTLALLVILPLPFIAASKEFVLADAALAIGGRPFLILLASDAFLVLSGAVLTSYVGVSGLVYRMALDGCLPTLFQKKNRRGAPTRIVFGFFLLAGSVLWFTHGDLLALAGVYALSFLSVMSLFAVANLVLRRTRPELKRPYKAPLAAVLLALLATTVGLAGTLALDPRHLGYFLAYFIPAIAIVYAEIHKKTLWRLLKRYFWFFPPIRGYMERKLAQALEAEVYIFLHRASNIFRALRYVDRNESGHRVTIVHCKYEDMDQRKLIHETLPALERGGVFPHFRVRFAYVPSAFTPKTVDAFARKRHIPKHRIFIGTIHSHHDYDYADFGGVRIIL